MMDYVDVLEYMDAGKLDGLAQSAANDADLDNIRRFVRLDAAIRRQTTGGTYDRTRPSIERQVLVSFWEKPRTGFHYEQTAGLLQPIDFGSKLLDIPWSSQAFNTFKRNNNVKGLHLEHVTPIKQLWQCLLEIEKADTTKNGTDWRREAGAYLRNNYRVAVVTEDEAKGIDRYFSRDRNPFRDAQTPFKRYEAAINKARKKKAGDRIWAATKALDTSKFVHPGRN
ncbi:hypothetical protein BISA_2327 [Bifidobacterium saguini DSM 23967]|uniref:Uncharacterized protein n=2 Tax=Bifidobacterium saguini TaxID=762210 RepID=A0A087D250_9BIFI|nr:hypothetical protein [Bifidobacterium saguini]KFI89600.1 hypothetical protein BISA_2327 [Bifidobacterium saguini DSM 23967]QTB90710.1 hypothetical protein BSD967_10520 [Bifidobacterium saguini]